MAAVGAVQKENRPANAARGAVLSSGELKMMLGQCLKMASENKITASNTWGLPLIDHLDDLVKDDDPAQNMNFQRASVTLDAGVKIYSYRVDSVHTETFKILGGLGRASGPGEEGEEDLGDGGVGENASPSKRKRRGQELNPEATLEPTLEALNVKKFDLAFAVDPLFHKTSAQFDEGGAKGLLLNNLSVYQGCEIVFDSMDVPEAAVEDADANTTVSTAQVELDTVKPQLDAILARGSALGEQRITPTLDNILALLGAAPGEGAAAQADEFVRSVAQGRPIVSPDLPTAAAAAESGIDAGGDAEMMDMDDDGAAQTEGAAAVEPYAYGDDDFGGYDGGYDDYADDVAHDDTEGTFGHHAGETMGGGAMVAGEASASLEEDAISWLIAAGNSSGSYVTSSKGWAGATHWRYRAVPQGEKESAGDEDDDDEMAGGKKKRGGARKRNQPLDFVALMAEGLAEPEFEMLPKGGGRRASRRSKTVAKTLLPEDHHYKPESLARYALRPRTAVAVVGSSNGTGPAIAGAFGGDADQQFNDFGDAGFGGFDGSDDYDDGNGDAYGGEWPDFEAFAEGTTGEDLELAQASHKVEKVEVNYSRAAKQVDVRSLKELMWNGMQTVVNQRGGDEASVIEFSDILATVPENNAAGRIEDLSIHLCFICVLHLANEHGLVVRGVPELDRLQVSNLPLSA